MKNEKVQANPGMDGREMKKLVAPMLPSPEYLDCEIRDIEIAMPDGVRLAASVSCPDFTKKWPVVLMRYPYIFYDWIREFYHELFAEHGYACLLVQVRGTVHSEGEFQALEEDRDGRSVLDWIGVQPWCDGSIATIGASYCGETQWSIADCHHPMLKTMFISVFGAEAYDVFYHRGLFRADTWTEWTAQMHGDTKYIMKFGADAEALRQQAFSASPQNRIGEQLDGQPCEWYKTWAASWRGDEDYWKSGFWGKMAQMPEQLDIPVFLHGGWYDVFLHTMLSSYQRIPEDIRKKSAFMIGPWVHSGLPGGDRQYPGEGKAGYLQIVSAIKWFDYIIKGKEYTEPLGCVEAYSIGEDQWETFENGFTHDSEQTFWLDGASSLAKAHMAGKTIPEEDAALSYSYDPEHPVKSRGGTLISNHNDPMAGAEASCLQEAVGSRDDVLSFVTDIFEEKTKISGSVKAHLFVSSDAPATAFTVKLSEIFADGRTLNIRDDFTDIRWRDSYTMEDYTPGEVVELTFDMLDILWQIQPGSRLRIDVSSSNSPAFLPHKNTLVPWGEATESVVAQQTIYTGEAYPSRIILPVTNERQ